MKLSLAGAFLASPESGWITAQMLDGRTAKSRRITTQALVEG